MSLMTVAPAIPESDGDQSDRKVQETRQVRAVLSDPFVLGTQGALKEILLRDAPEPNNEPGLDVPSPIFERALGEKSEMLATQLRLDRTPTTRILQN